MEEIKRCMREVKRILNRTVGILDTSGVIIACTEPELEGTEDSSVRAVMKSEDLFLGTSEDLFPDGQRGQHTVYCLHHRDGSGRSFEPWVVAQWVGPLSKPEYRRGTSAFIKNILLENELPGDIPLKARSTVSYTLNRIVFIVRITIGTAPNVWTSFRICTRIPDLALRDGRETIVLVMEIEAEFDDFVTTGAIRFRTADAESMSRQYRDRNACPRVEGCRKILPRGRSGFARRQYFRKREMRDAV